MSESNGSDVIDFDGMAKFALKDAAGNTVEKEIDLYLVFNQLRAIDRQHRKSPSDGSEFPHYIDLVKKHTGAENVTSRMAIKFSNRVAALVEELEKKRFGEAELCRFYGFDTLSLPAWKKGVLNAGMVRMRARDRLSDPDYVARIDLHEFLDLAHFVTGSEEQAQKMATELAKQRVAAGISAYEGSRGSN